MYELLQDISQRPEPFSRYTAKELWTRPHLARQMLQYHLNQETELASRRFETIDQIVSWIDSQLGLSGKRVCDLGCGPGLYTQRFAARGADVNGVDFSAHSLEYARLKAKENKQSISYTQADYLSDDLPVGFDIVTLIYTDYSVLSPTQRASLLGRIRKMLKPGGRLVMDVAGMGSLANKEECTLIESNLMNGFWAEGDYVGIQRSFVYPDECLSVDRYVIVEPAGTWQVFNWFQYFTPADLQKELGSAGFAVEQMFGGLRGEPLQADGDFIGVIASMR
ncbi:class I SAM-dependent methyltransferase [Pseudomonadota bacterium]